MTDKPDAWMPFYVGDYLKDTGRLTTEQHGAYVLLILDYWCNGAPPADDAVLSQITRMDKAAWRKHKSVVLGYFREEGGKLVHKRIEQELQSARANSERRSEKARAAAEARWGKDAGGNQGDMLQQPRAAARRNATSNAPSMPDAMLGQCPPPSPLEGSTTHPSSPATPGRPPAPAPAPAPADARAPAREGPDDALQRVLFEAGMIPNVDAQLAPTAREAAMSELVGWLGGGADLERDILPTVKAMVAERPEVGTNSLKRFAKQVCAAARGNATIGESTKRVESTAVTFDREGEGPICADVRRRVCDRLEPDSYATWIDPLELKISADGDHLAVVATTPFNAEWVKNNFEGVLQAAANAAGGKPMRLLFRVANQQLGKAKRAA